jgi:hypothetical protein
MGFFHGVFTVFKFLMGLGALATLLVMGLLFLWYIGHALVRSISSGQPSERPSSLRKLFLES